MMSSSATIAADFYPKSGNRKASLVVYVIEAGQRRSQRIYDVDSKRDARKIAAYLNAEPWNF